MKPTVSSILLPILAAVGMAHAATGPEIVARHAITLNAPVGEPTSFMPRGPLLGNGDVGVMQSGPAEQLVFYIGKNDFWSTKHNSVITVGQLRLFTPELQGAGFQTVTDMLQAEIRGTYTLGDAAMTSRSWVDAHRNLLCVELSNTGGKPLTITPHVIMGASAAVPPKLQTNENAVKTGCEQHGGGRWFFNGEMAGLTIHDRALPHTEIATQAKAERKNVQSFDGKTGKPFPAPAITKALTLSGWIKAASLSTEANYIFSKGEWNHGFSLGLSNGHPRFAIGGNYLQADDQIPLNQWVHVAGTFDGREMVLMVDGKVVKSSAAPASVADGAFLYHPDAPNSDGRKVGVATHVIGADGLAGISLAPGASVVIATAIQSDLDAGGKCPLESAKSLLAGLKKDQLAANSTAHRQWWHDYWSRSFVEVPDKTIEQCWYASWYIMGSCSRAGKVAPGLWGNWLTVDNPAWHGDFHLNYNFQAPFYGLYSANRAETTLPLYDAMNQFLPRGRKIAAAKGWKGIHLPVSIGPWGMCPEGDDCDWGQRSNAAYVALPFIWYWNHTRDAEWLKTTGYEYLRETAAFWEDYLKFENGRYVIYNDSIHEGSGPDMNAILSLGLVKCLFKNIIPMSEALGVDADKRDKWRDIVEKISDFPLQERDGKTVFRYSEKGTAWWNDNTLGIQHIFPAGAIGLDSDPKLLEISHNTINAMGRWRDFNGSSSWYTACARVGYDPKKILSELANMYSHHALPNKLLNFGGGGIENVSPALAVTEMLMQSHDGVIRLFPCWPRDMDARFGTLRAVGAFLVSAALEGGVITGVKIISEKGSDCVIANPWPEKSVRVIRPGKPAELVTGSRLTLKTSINEIIELKPE
jgi:Concanavalin A-like lectin/glucanases superfamily/Glycosyl hydrolase family 65 central catalytic domain